MKRILSSVLALSLVWVPAIVLAVEQPVWGQNENARQQEAQRLLEKAMQQSQQGQPQQALQTLQQVLAIGRQLEDKKLEAYALLGIGTVYNSIGQPQQALQYFNQALPILRQVGNRAVEATTLNNIGRVYRSIGQPQQALQYYNQALPVSRQVGNRAGEATTLNNIGLVYHSIGQPQQALQYYNQALPIRRQVGDRAGEAATLANIGRVYHSIGQPQQALQYYNQALPVSRQVGDRAGEATTLANIGAVYIDTNRPAQAITNLEQSFSITLEMRRGLFRENRQNFLQTQRGTAIALTALLIDQNQPDRAYEWVNRATTFDLADYTHLLNAKVANSAAQQAIERWNQQNQQLQLLHQRLQQNFSEALARQIRELEAQTNQQAEAIARQFPEVAELFETTPTDIAQLRAIIPSNTTVIHPVLLTNINHVPNTIAIFVLTKERLTVTKIAINPAEFERLLAQTYAQLTNRFEDRYLDNLAKLYDILIRPVTAQIQATKPTQLSIIATGKLRYIPFETLYDSKTDQYLIQKYPISYLTRLSTHSLQARTPNSSSPPKLLALGNPIPTKPLALDGADVEVKSITQILPGSEAFIHEQATLDTFKTQALRFPLLHLATHGCFQQGGCPKLGLKANTILFADRRLNIADAALLGLQNTDLITLSACQTALETNSNGEEIAGLAYLFERAGARSVIASLWSAEDKTTEEIMVQFYKNLKQGMSKEEALRQAKLSQIGSHPFFWSPFVLIGDGR